MKWPFNLSYSAYSTYKESELQFYFQYILKAKPDTEVYEIYGLGGQIIHSFSEEYVKNPNLNIEELFNNLWTKYNLDTKSGVNNAKLDKNQYITSIYNVKKHIDFLKKEYNEMMCEKKIEFISKEFDNITIKGYIDFFIQQENKILIVDWKTNSSYDFKTHELQRKFYSWLCWKEYNIIPLCKWIYTKKNAAFIQTFTEEDMLLFNTEILKFISEIKQKGRDITKYDEGNWHDNIFNTYYKQCREEVMRRETERNKINIKYDIICNYIQIIDKLPEQLLGIIDKKFSYDINGKEFSPLFQSKRWDGKVHLFRINKQILPIGLFSMFKELINDYNEHFKTNYSLELNKDYRMPINYFGNKFLKNENFELRYYQEDAVKKALEDKIGILELGTGAGKSLIASEIIRRLDLETLFVINRIELVTQTAEMFEEYIGIEAGTILEGSMNIKNGINVVSIQSINAILKRQDKTTKELIKHLKNVQLLIYDECHTVTDSGSYHNLAKHIINCHFIIGLTGTAFRNDEHTLKMKALVGDVIYKKTTKELVDEDYLTPTKCYFINNELEYENERYTDGYDRCIVQNNKRNNKVKKIIEENKDKKILILTKLIKHGEILNELILGSKLITSSTNKIDRKEDFNSYKLGEYNILIGSYMLYSTGINIPEIDVIINVSGNKSSISVLQSIGRVMRKVHGKDFAYYYDFYDYGSKYFASASKQRINILKEFGHEVEIIK